MWKTVIDCLNDALSFPYHSTPSPAPNSNRLSPSSPHHSDWTKRTAFSPDPAQRPLPSQPTGFCHVAAEAGSRPLTSMGGVGGGVRGGGNPSEEQKKRMRKLRGYHELGMECLQRGVKADEGNDRASALNYYHRFLDIVQEALLIDLPSPSPEAETLLRELTHFTSTVNGRISDIKPDVRYGAAPMTRARSARAPATQSFSASGYEAAQAHPQPPLKTTCFAGKANTRQQQRPAANRHTQVFDAQPNTSLGAKQSGVTGQGATRGQSHGCVDPKLVEMIESEILDRRPTVSWDDIAGLEKAKQALQEMVILPSLRQDLFQGIRKPARGLLLFGPPGNGKTLLARAVASQAQATFFNVSAASLTSKWMGEGEKLVRALFALAAERQPSVIFIDEIDSILSERSQGEHEASRRLKTEFLVQFDGVLGSDSEHVVVMGATNRPEELDEAARRRLVKRIYIPLPDAAARSALLKSLSSARNTFSISGRDMEQLVKLTAGFSGSDLKALCQEAAMGPIRELGARVSSVKASDVRKVQLKDFEKALEIIKPSVDSTSLKRYEDWAKKFGSSS